MGNSIRHALEGLTYQLLTSPPTAHPLRLYFVVLEFPSLLDPSFSQVHIINRSCFNVKVKRQLTLYYN